MKAIKRYYQSFIEIKQSFVEKRDRLLAKSEVYSVYKNTKETYRVNRKTNGRVRAMTDAVSENARKFGIKNSIYAGTGALFGTFLIPLPSAALACAECFLKLSKAGTKLAQKNHNKFMRTA